jgi:hypothetical protein
MKLADLKRLTETTNEYVVFQVTSPKTDKVYYGYTIGRDVRKAFLAGAERSNEPDRGDVRMMMAAGDDIEGLRFKLLDVFDDELTAFMARNDARAGDGQSITGPTNFPTAVFQRAKALDPERVRKWKITGDINSATAREAMGDEFKSVAAYTFADLKQLTTQHPEIKKQLTADLDKLSYPQFKTKYFPDRK